MKKMMSRMMKCVLCLVAILVCALCACAQGESAPEWGRWGIQAFADKYGLPSDNYYIFSGEPLSGSCETEKGTKDLDAMILLCADAGTGYENLIFKLWVNDIPVKNNTSQMMDFTATFTDSHGNVYTALTGLMGPGDEAVCFYRYGDIPFMVASYDRIIESMSTTGPMRIALKADNSSTTYYIGIKDIMGFAEVYAEWQSRK